MRLTEDLGDGWYQRIGIWGVVDQTYWESPEAIRGRDIRVETTLTDATGCAASAVFTARVSTEPGR